VLGVGVAFDPFLARSNAFSRAVAALHGFRRFAENLDQHRIVDIPAECAFYSLQIGLGPVAVAGELNAVGETGLEVVHRFAAGTFFCLA